MIRLYANNIGGVEVWRLNVPVLKAGLTVFAVLCKCQFPASQQAQIMYTTQINYCCTILLQEDMYSSQDYFSLIIKKNVYASQSTANEIISLCLFTGMHNEWVFISFYVCAVIGLFVFLLLKLLTNSKFCPCLAVKITTYLCQH